MTDWRLPEHRREAFQLSYTFSLETKGFPGMVYSFLPAIADAFELDAEGRAWLVWLNGNTQNAVTSLMLLEAAPEPVYWGRAVEFWNDNFKLLEWDTDRRHQKSKFGEATDAWWRLTGGRAADMWGTAADGGWDATWAYAFGQPHMGRLSAWSMIEYARILFGPVIPDASTFMLNDKAGSRSHRNAVALIAGYDSVYWDADAAHVLGLVDGLEVYAEELLLEATVRNAVLDNDSSWQEGVATYEPHPDVTRLTMESALCTYKSWHKPNRRYPNCYADMMYNRIRKAEVRFGRSFELLWETRRRDLPERLRLESNPRDPGLAPVKQNHYLETGKIPFLDTAHFNLNTVRKDPLWTAAS